MIYNLAETFMTNDEAYACFIFTSPVSSSNDMVHSVYEGREGRLRSNKSWDSISPLINSLAAVQDKNMNSKQCSIHHSDVFEYLLHC